MHKRVYGAAVTDLPHSKEGRFANLWVGVACAREQEFDGLRITQLAQGNGTPPTQVGVFVADQCEQWVERRGANMTQCFGGKPFDTQVALSRVVR
jgi:hypothetical protein